MNTGACLPLLQTLAQPQRAQDLGGGQWTSLIGLARACNLLGTLEARLRAADVAVPAAPARHLDGVRQLALRQRLSVRWEAHELARALRPLAGPVLLLKGAAYLLGESPSGEGRLFGDIDLLVPREQLGEAEKRLMLSGWVSAKRDPYDQRYYREWMHELPPMTHLRRGSSLDLHHNLLPLTARHHPDMAALLARARPLPGFPGLYVPAPEDLLIHSLTHLVHEGELHHGLRDLVDIDAMLRAYPQQDAAFWARLEAAVQGHGLQQPVALGLRLVEQELGTPLPPTLLAEARREPPRWLLTAFHHALHAVAGSSARAPFSEFLIYLRGHALRMPPGLLMRHLAIKAWRDATAKPPPMPDEERR